MPGGDVLDDRLLRIADLCAKVAMGRSTIYQAIADGHFPRAVEVGGGVRWRASDINEWIAARPVRAV